MIYIYPPPPFLSPSIPPLGNNMRQCLHAQFGHFPPLRLFFLIYKSRVQRSFVGVPAYPKRKIFFPPPPPPLRRAGGLGGKCTSAEEEGKKRDG